MKYEDEFERDFMRRTLQLVETYRGPHDATLLLNSLLGLLLIPKERYLDRIPADPVADLPKWGIRPSSILAFPAPTKANPEPETIRGVVHSLRNAVAHSRFKPIHHNRVVDGFEYSDKSGFSAVIQVDEMREFVSRLATYLERAY